MQGVEEEVGFGGDDDAGDSEEDGGFGFDPRVAEVLKGRGQRVVGRVTARDGSVAYVVQTRQWGATFAGKGKKFTTMFFVRRPDGKWRGYYGEYEDDRWSGGDCQVNVSDERVVFYRRNVPAITFVWATEKYTLHARPEYDGAPFTPDRVPGRF